MTISQLGRFSGTFGRVMLTCAIGVPLSGCAIMSAAGPSSRAVNRADRMVMTNNASIKIIDVSDAVARRVIAAQHQSLFSESLGDGYAAGSIIGRGDVLDIAIWEAPPAALFGAAGGDSRLTTSSSTARGTTLPEQMVSSEGRINIPFVGSVVAAGRTSSQIEREITKRLAGKAHLPQVIVRMVRNSSSNVTVVGDVTSSARVPVTAKGERLLDVLASVGGVRQPIGKMTIQITRGQKIASMPLGAVIRDPRQNIRLQPDDVVTALFQPFSFTALGAAGRNDELPLEGTGVTLAQALGRVAGIQDQRADVKGVFIFRLEDLAALDPTLLQSVQQTPDGKVAVIYRVNLKDPSTFFVAQSFPIRDKDVVYVSNAPLADIQKFVSVISSTVFPIATVSNAVP
ncbi:polysaccharide biosynthesis/export family protein [Sphingomonas sp. PWP1-2]|uniref:polysaccharide biosynthesis/export family protein n=1 Tax=Sphingomonas sp. PWP1-2 TaxID=2804558 RepID=UPI003CF1E374